MNTQTLSQNETFATLHQFAKAISNPMSVEQKFDMDSFFAFCAEGSDSDSQKMIATLLLKALKNQMNEESVNDHIYLKDYEISQIQLFNILIEKFPFVKYSQLIANNAIINAIGDSEEAAIIDIGIGQGAQVMNMLNLCAKLPNLKKLQIIGIEPFADALAQAEIHINTFAENAHFEISFHGVHTFAEDIDFKEFKGISENIIVNASLALHHIQESNKRSATIANIKAINPKAFLLIEPNVNHMETNLANRFLNCYNHYYNIFRVIDHIEISQNDKNALKQFFGREIEDVIGKEEADRYERHELATSWIGRLTEAGFTLNPQQLVSPVESEAGVQIKNHREGFLGFTFDQETILAVMYAA